MYYVIPLREISARKVDVTFGVGRAGTILESCVVDVRKFERAVHEDELLTPEVVHRHGPVRRLPHHQDDLRHVPAYLQHGVDRINLIIMKVMFLFILNY